MSATTEKSSLIERVVAGDTRAVARAISKVEDGSKDAAQLMKDIFPHTGRGLIMGITGAPGAGKSSLVDKLALHYRQRGERVGIVAVDPSSPFLRRRHSRRSHSDAGAGSRSGRLHSFDGHSRQSWRTGPSNSRCGFDTGCGRILEDHHRNGRRRPG